jgi:nucleotide-binding universal stress UspA family protein
MGVGASGGSVPAVSDHPILFCYDGSDESGRALSATIALIAPHERAVVLTVWQPLTARLTETGGFGVFALEDESEIDDRERDAARRAAEEGARRVAEGGLTATSRVEEARSGVWRTVIDVADELDAALIVCGTRGRGSVRSALLGSTSHDVLQHAGRPVLISPAPRD